MSVFRAYFVDAATREEVVGHKFNGKSWLGTSGNCHVDGAFVRGTCLSVNVCDHSSLRHIENEQRVTAADFDRPVMVKVWGPKSVDWRLLRADNSPLSPVEQVAAAWCEDHSTY